MSTLAALIWDMDGTLIDSAEVVPSAFVTCVAAAGGPILGADEVIGAYHVGPPTAIIGHLLGRTPEPQAIEHFYEVLSELAHGVLTAFPGVAHALHRLRERTRLAVFTGGSQRAARILLTAAGLIDQFEVVVGGDEVTLPKPAPDGLLETCSRLRLAPANCAYIGDSPLDVEAATRAGVLAVAARWGHLFTETSGESAQLILDQPSDAMSLLNI